MFGRRPEYHPERSEGSAFRIEKQILRRLRLLRMTLP